MNNKALIYMFFFSTFWAVDILLGKWIYSQGVDPMSWIVLVYAFVLVFWGSYVVAGKQLQPKELLMRSKIPFLLVSITAALGTGLSYVGLSMTQAINYSFLAQSSMIFTVVLAHLWFTDEKLSKIKTGLMLLFIGGIYLVSTNGKLIIPQQGDILVIIGALFFAINNVTIKTCLQRGIHVPMIILGRNIVTFVLGGLFVYVGGIDLQGGISLRIYALLSALCVCIWLTALNKVVEHSSPSYMTMMAMINPVLVVVGASLFLGESISLLQMIGGGIIVVSGIVLEVVRRKRI